MITKCDKSAHFQQATMYFPEYVIQYIANSFYSEHDCAFTEQFITLSEH